ncbi:MAG: hypothetical protein CHACPFDD_00776 [Phycisphaerae bacterium]|nr:hypothetical protein [Phycisphaerae bacterium]
MMPVTTGVLMAVLPCIPALEAAVQTKPQTAQPQPVSVLVFAAQAVDGVDELVLRDGAVVIQHREWQPMVGVKTECPNATPREPGFRIAVRNRDGRPAVHVIQQPAAENGYETRVLIDDGPEAGAAPLRFELVAVRGRSAPRPHNVVLITIDSLRPDRLGCYGHTRSTSPNLDAFAAQSVRFTRAFSASSFTPPTHASLLTSRYVGDHGLLTWNRLDDAQVTLPEVLSENGYRTGASVCLNLLSEQQLGQGVEWRREGTRDGREVVSDALEFIRGPARPFFLWIHLYDVHRPYGRVANWTDAFGQTDRPELGNQEGHYNLRPQDVRRQRLSDAHLAYLVDRYDAGIAYADAQLAPLLAELSAPARRADTMVVITADHGESLLEHPERLFSHDPFLYSSVTHIPLLIRYPDGRGAGSVCDALVSQIDVAPTVLDVLGVEKPPAFAGLSLAALAGGATLPRDEIYAECWGWETLKSVRTRAQLLICNMKDNSPQRFVLSSDPGERTPIAGDQPGDAALVERLQRFSQRAAAAQPPVLDPETLKKLKSLGYAE